MNNNQKKILSIALSVSLLFSAACNKNRAVPNMPPKPIRSEEPKQLKLKQKKKEKNNFILFFFYIYFSIII